VQQAGDAPQRQLGFGYLDVLDEGRPAAGQVHRHGQPPLREPGVADRGQMAAVLVVAAGELHVVQDDPDVGGE
jgi:hypothetical protein